MKLKKNCLNCERSFEVYPSEIKKGNGKFCSRSCATTFRNIHNNPAKDALVKWKISKHHADVKDEKNPMYGRKGKLSPSYIDGRNKFNGETYRRKLLASGRESVCKICGESREKLDVHHVDGNRRNNELNNLIWLCKKCHNTIAHENIRDEFGKIVGKKLNKVI